MTIEVASFIGQLDPTYPTDEDFKYEGDDHIRLTKQCARASFPNVTGAVTATHGQLNSVLRAVLTPVGEAQMTLPAIADRASKLQGYDAAGLPSVTRSLTAFDADVQSTASNAGIAAGAAGVAVPAAAASTAARDLSQKWATQPAGEVVAGQGYSSFYYSVVAAGYKTDVQQLKADTAQLKQDALNAAAAAAASAVQAGSTEIGTSTTSNTLGTGVKPFVSQPNKAWQPNATLLSFGSASTPGARYWGLLTAYDPATGAGALLATNFTGTPGAAYTDWNIGVTGADGNSAGGSTPDFILQAFGVL